MSTSTSRFARVWRPSISAFLVTFEPFSPEQMPVMTFSRRSPFS